jgi:hypothetical protein
VLEVAISEHKETNTGIQAVISTSCSILNAYDVYTVLIMPLSLVLFNINLQGTLLATLFKL